MYKVYLVGFISGEHMEECVEWRKKIVMHYRALNWNIIFLDPLNGKSLESIDKEGLHSSIPDKAFLHRDYKCVAESDLIIAHMNTFGSTRPSLGSIYELAWAWLLRKPVILITKDAIYKDHPFTKDTYSVVVESVEEMIEKKYLNYFYKGTVSAKY